MLLARDHRHYEDKTNQQHYPGFGFGDRQHRYRITGNANVHVGRAESDAKIGMIENRTDKTGRRRKAVADIDTCFSFGGIQAKIGDQE